MLDNRTFFHTVAYRGSVTNGTTNTAIAGVADNIIPKASSGAFLFNESLTIRAGLAGGVNASRSRINTPNVRAVGLPYIAPISAGVTNPSPLNVADFGTNGPQPNVADEVSIEATHTDAGAQIQWAALWLRRSVKPWTPADRYRIRGTAAITGVVGSWASGAITLDQNLPAGIYEIQGMDAFGTNLLLARLIFPGGGLRPGCAARNAVANVPHPMFTDGRLGVYGQFDTVALPQLEIFVEAANSAQEIYFDIARVSNR